MVKDIRKLIEKQRDYYKSIVSVYSPLLQETVYFTSEGFNHLLFKSNRSPRKLSERYMKLMCLSYTVKVISKCKTASETRQYIRLVRGKKKTATSHELVYEIEEGKMIRVIVERVGTGKLKFLSVMPHKNSSKPKKRR